MVEQTTDTKRQRSCVACRKRQAKADLHRFVRGSGGMIVYDSTGKAAGRGAYVCSQKCFYQALGTKSLERALRATLSGGVAEVLEVDFLQALSDEKER